MLHTDGFKNLIPYFKFVQKVLGEENIFFVGGVVRDILLGIKNYNFQDIDITLAKDPEKLYFQIDKNLGSVFRTEKFGTITIIDKKLNCQYEITPFRKEGIYSDVRHPDQLDWTDNLLEDSARRDFTINCLYYAFIDSKEDKTLKKQNFKDKDEFIKHIKNYGFAIFDDNIVVLKNENIIEKVCINGKINKDQLKKYIGDFGKLHLIIDPFFGIKDLIDQKIKAVGNPDDRIKEDALRIIRAIRFVSILNIHEHINLDFESKTWISLKKFYFLIRKVAKERVIQEIKKVFINGNAFGFIALMDELNILKYFFPGFYNLKNIEQPVRYHPFDCYAHTILALYYLEKINTNYLVKFGILYHDVGKADQYYRLNIKKDIESQTEIYKLEINHPVIGTEITENDFKKLGFSKKEIEEISFYVLYHMLPGEIVFMSEKKQEQEIKKFISKYGLEKLLNLCDITIADRLGQYNPLQHANIDVIVELKNKINKIYNESGRITLKELKVNGNDIAKLLGKSGPEVGKILNELLEFVLDDEKRNQKDILTEKAISIIKELK